jgi:hypothetical protein
MAARSDTCWCRHRASARSLRAFDEARQLGAHGEGLAGMPSGEIERCGRPAGQTIDARD